MRRGFSLLAKAAAAVVGRALPVVQAAAPGASRWLAEAAAGGPNTSKAPAARVGRRAGLTTPATATAVSAHARNIIINGLVAVAAHAWNVIINGLVGLALAQPATTASALAIGAANSEERVVAAAACGGLRLRLAYTVPALAAGTLAVRGALRAPRVGPGAGREGDGDHDRGGSWGEARAIAKAAGTGQAAVAPPQP